MDIALRTTGLVRRFGDFTAVDGLDLEVPKGSLYGFLGPNGAGKSTTMKCLTGLIEPSAGTMEILGLDPLASPIELKRRIGVVPEGLALLDRLTGAENLAFAALPVIAAIGLLSRLLDMPWIALLVVCLWTALMCALAYLALPAIAELLDRRREQLFDVASTPAS